MNPTPIEVIAAVLFAVALVHTFSTGFFETLAHRQPRHAKLWHLVGEVEIVFGLWAIALVAILMALQGRAAATAYVDARNYIEPLFVFAIMVVAASKPILTLAKGIANGFARVLPMPSIVAIHFTGLFLIPLLGSLITEPAAMTLAALLLKDRFFGRDVSARAKYITVGTLFVNISIGGALTPFAAPPVLMVAATWGWDLSFMLSTFGAHVLPVVLINAALASALCFKELKALPPEKTPSADHTPLPLLLLHVGLLVGIVVFAHHPPIFLGLMLLFLGLATAYPQYQNKLMLKEALLVAFFLAGLVVLGGLQAWWLKPLLLSLDAKTVYLGATALTAITDNAALTYLASQVDGLSDPFKYYVVAGAISGGGLTVIANAPNPAGMAILRERFPGGTVGALGLLAGALTPTLITVIAFYFF
ncbi:MAG: putative Na+/H+ antiporter [Stagnimonas sp.]|nr:putative Na+/H+ antiporter [Stagnimonas sp.]